MQHNLSKIDSKYLKERVEIVNQLESSLKSLQNEIGSLIQLICHQNDLEGEWILDIINEVLIKKEEEKNA